MRTREEIDLVLRLVGSGLGSKAIARATGIPRKHGPELDHRPGPIACRLDRAPGGSLDEFVGPKR
jgi:hypothetical protein